MPEEQSSKTTMNVTGVHSVEARAADRETLAQDVEAFLKKGGAVTEVPRNYRADPPKKPENNYGRGSI
jgi:hypothetical protein